MPWISRDEAQALVAREADRLPARFRGCAMCGLVAGAEDDTEILAENDHAVAVLDRFWSRRGHVLVVLRRHVESIGALPWEEYAGAQRLAWELSRAMERRLDCKRVYVAALGAVSPLPTTFPHHHVHVVPLYHGDDRDKPSRVLTWSEGVGVYAPGEAAEVAAALRGALR